MVKAKLNRKKKHKGTDSIRLTRRKEAKKKKRERERERENQKESNQINEKSHK